jgi:nitrite reductase/ring-hydroxylating ferredoxin subunit
MVDAFEPVRIADARRPLSEGEARRFSIRLDGIPRDAFAVCWHGRTCAYVNSCRHQAQNLDFGDGHFFDDAFDALVCCHHGARYAPDTGLCVEGPCAGKRLTALSLETRDDGLWCTGVGRGNS